jgi:hypothetical protein
MPPRGARHAARVAGRKRYLSEKPCPKGHVGEHLVRNGACVECNKALNRIRARAWELAHPEEAKARKHRGYLASRPRRRAQADEWAKRNPEKVRATARRWRQANKERFAAMVRDWRARNPAAYRVQKYRRRSSNPLLARSLTPIFCRFSLRRAGSALIADPTSRTTSR